MEDDLIKRLYGLDHLLAGAVVAPSQEDERSFAAASAARAAATRLGENGADSLVGTVTDDRLVGRGGNDTLIGLAGNDLLIGGGGNDRLIGAAGNDTLKAGGGDDVVKGGGGNDRLIGGGGNDKLAAGGGDDFLKGGGGNDKLKGGGGSDNLKGGGGNDTLKGGGGDDRLRGGLGDDSLNGGGADDSIDGGTGSDLLRGGFGSDLFVFRSSEFRSGAVDRILDFKTGEDKIDLTAVAGAGTFDSIDFGRFGNALTIEIGTGRVILSGISSEASLSADDFILSGIVDDVPDDGDEPGTGGGDDTMGGGGDDTMPGGDDTIGGGGDDTMPGGDDTTGGGGDDTMPGGGGDDTMPGGDDTTGGGGGDDTMPGGDDTTGGGGGDDTMPGGDDTTTGGGGDDTMPGGDDTTGGGGGDDTMPGGDDTTGGGGGDDTMPGGDDTTGGGGDDTMPGGDDTTGGGGGDDTMPGGDDTMPADDGPLQVIGTNNPEVIGGTDEDEEVLGLGGNDTLGTSGGVDTLIGGSGADIFAIRLEDGILDADVDIVQDFDYIGGDQIGLIEVLAGIEFDLLSEVVNASVTGGDTLIQIDRGDGFETGLRLEGVTFTTSELLGYGFQAPAANAAAFVENPYGFTNTSNTVADPFATRDGQYVAFVDKQNLDDLTGDVTPFIGPDEFGGFDTNEDSATMDVFVRNMSTGSIQRASVSGDGDAILQDNGSPANATSPVLSEDGRFVFFVSNGQADAKDENDSGDVYMRDLLADTAPVLISVNGGEAAGGVPVGSNFITSSVSVIDVSADGRKIAYVTETDILGSQKETSDTNNQRDVYLRDLDTGITTLVSVNHNLTSGSDSNAGGGVADPYSFAFGDAYDGDVVKMSADGRYVAYVTNNSHVFTEDRNGFFSNADPDGGFDVYLRDTAKDRTMLISDGFDVSDIQSFDMSADGTRIVYSTENAIDDDDTNGLMDVYLAEIDLDAFEVTERSRVSEAQGGFELKGGNSYGPTISADGNRVAFISDATDASPVDPTQFSLGGTRLLEVDLTTGELTTSENFYVGDTGTGAPFSSSAFVLTDDSLVYRKQIGSGDTIEVSETVALPDFEVPSDASGSLRLETVGGSKYFRSSIDFLFDSDVYYLGANGNRFTVSVEGLDGGGGSLANPSIQIRSGSPTGPVVASDSVGGIGSDPFVFFDPDTGTDYYLRVSSGTFGQTGTYRVWFDAGFPRGDTDTSFFLELDTPVSDRLFSSTTSDYYRFDAEDGMRYQVNLTPTGFSDPLAGGIIRIRDENDQVLSSSSAGDASLDFFAPDDGLLFVEVDVSSSASANPGTYDVSIEEDPLVIVVVPPVLIPIDPVRPIDPIITLDTELNTDFFL